MRRNHESTAVDNLDPRRKRLSHNVTKNKITNLKLSTFRALRKVTIYSIFQQHSISLYITTTYNQLIFHYAPSSRNEILRYAPGKVHPTTGHEGPEEVQNSRSTLSLISALEGGEWSTLRRGARYPLYRWLGGPQAGLDGRGKSRPPPGFDPRTSYTDCANTAHHISLASVVDIQCTHLR